MLDKRDAISSVLWFAVAVFVFLSSIHLGTGHIGNPGPGFVSFWASIFFTCFTVLMLVLNLFGKKSAPGLSEAWKGLHWGKVVIVIASCIIYLSVMEKLGYLLATVGLMLVLFGLSKMKSWVVVLSSLIAVTSSYYLFHILLKVPLPRGILSF